MTTVAVLDFGNSPARLLFPFGIRSFWYSLFMLTGVVLSLILWSRPAKRDARLFPIYVTGLAGAFFGAKIVYLLAEGWMHFGRRDVWFQLATGKSILGALLGGYVAVELAKRVTGYRNATGDWFAMIAPVSVLMGRVGCLLNGCCAGKVCEPSWYTIRDFEGVSRWPSVPVEMAFNLIAVIAFFILRRRRLLAGQHFHLYLIAYGIFRFLHEFMRATPHLGGGLSGYQVAAMAVAGLGVAGFLRRRRVSQTVPICRTS